jgi:uncharacterized protein YndB with AHSA1/START domain
VGSAVVTVEIDASLEAVWAILVDVERWPEWTPSVRRARRLDTGPFAVGSRVRLEQPRLPPAVWRVTELAAPHSFAWVSGAPGLTTVATHRLEPNLDGGTTVTLGLEQRGPLGGLVGHLLGGLTRRYVTAEAQGLKRRSEA